MVSLLQKSAEALAGASAKGQPYPPASMRDVNAISKLFPAVRNVSLTGAFATPQGFNRQEGWRFFTAACLGTAIANKESPLYSAIFLTADEAHPVENYTPTI